MTVRWLTRAAEAVRSTLEVVRSILPTFLGGKPTPPEDDGGSSPPPPPPEPPDLPPPPRVKLPRLTPAEAADFRLSLAEQAELRWRRQNAPQTPEIVTKLRQAGDPLAAVPHPSTLAPVEVLTASGIPEDQALELLLTLDDDVVDAQIEQARKNLTQSYEQQAQTILANAPTLPKTTQTRIHWRPLQGGAFEATGELETAIRAVYGQWLQSTLRALPTPPSVLILSPTKPTQIVPVDVWQQGSRAILRWLAGQWGENPDSTWFLDYPIATVRVAGWDPNALSENESP